MTIRPTSPPPEPPMEPPMPVLPVDPPAPPRWLRDSAVVLLGTFGACLLFARGIWHGLDAYQFLSSIEHGTLFNDRHPLYLTICWLFHRALAPLGASLFTAGVAASMAGTVLGAGMLHRAAVGLGLDRRDALLAAIAAAGCFCVLYFGTVVEIHGVFFGAAGVAWWAFAKYQATGSLRRAALAGALCGLATSVHATGHLMLGTFMAFAIAWAPRPVDRTRLVRGLAVMTILHFVTAAAVTTAALRITGAALPDPQLKVGLFEGTIGYVQRMLSLGTSWDTAARVLWLEWLQPFLPLSLLPLLLLPRRERRLQALALLACVAVYLVAAVVLLSPANTTSKPYYMPAFATIEYGAYFMPLALPAAVLSLRAVPAALRSLVPLLAWLCAGYALLHPDRPAGDDEVGRAVVELMQQHKARVICGGYEVLDPVKRRWPSCDLDSVYALFVFFAPMQRIDDSWIPAWFDSRLGLAELAGGPLFVTQEALDLMAATHDGHFDRLVREHIPAHYELVPEQHGAFRALRVQRKP